MSKKNLPDFCYSVNKVSGEIIILKRGEKGYYKTDIITKGKEESQEIVNEMNEKLGITKEQKAAMYWGSLFGFNTKGADPKNYDKNGKMIIRKEMK